MQQRAKTIPRRISTLSLVLSTVMVMLMVCMMINVSYCIGLEDLLKIKPSTYVFGSDQILEDANCTIASIEQNNNEKIFPILKELVVCFLYTRE